MADPRETPAMQQYYRFKRQHPGCVLMFRIGDFYEMFDEDAVKVAKAIGLTLTRRTEGMPMCGLPYHQLDVYLRKLISAGFRVAVCEQLADASQVKGIVPRGVTRVITPGTAIDESLLGGEAVNTLAAVIFTQSGDDSAASIACIEVSTGEFTVASCEATGLIDELARRGTRELLFVDPGDGVAPPRVKRVLDGLNISGTARPAWQFRTHEAHEALRERFGIASFEGFGIEASDPVLQAAGAAVRYLKETQTLSDEDAKLVGNVTIGRATLNHLRPPRLENAEAVCVIDAVSLRSLEVERTMRSGGSGGDYAGSLLGIFLSQGLVRTAMGKRMLRNWLCRPLRDRHAIVARQACVTAFVLERVLASHAVEALSEVQDIARIAGRVAMARCTPRDLVGLANSVLMAAKLGEVVQGCVPFSTVATALRSACERTRAWAERAKACCVDAPPTHLRDGGVFRDQVDSELDECRGLQQDSSRWLADYQAKLVTMYGLPNLKVGYNSVFGYYIELPASQAKQAPPELVRKQTLKNAERYSTPELRDYETRVLSAQSRALERERQLFAQLCTQGATLLADFAVIAESVAEIDCYSAMAEKAVKRGWRAPEMVDEPSLNIVQGRHPVLDELLDGELSGFDAGAQSGSDGARFVPNDITLGSSDEASLALITGPNMAGKSTFIRQTALIVLLAHTGSYVPAQSAIVGITDRIFTRIGADDALHAGQSTFMVEMVETANIINNASPSSLVVLDEVGRGTSTLDGLSLAWAIVEHLAGNTPAAPGPRVLFATHYHELTQLEEQLEGRVKNLHVAVREWQTPARDGEESHTEIIFLHRILPGRADQSYGLHVARLAGMPPRLIARGREVLASLAVHHAAAADDAGQIADNGSAKLLKSKRAERGQMSLFREYVAHPAVAAIKEIKLDLLTPIEAFDTLRRLKVMADDAT